MSEKTKDHRREADKLKVKLPNAKQSIKRSNEIQQARANHQGWVNFLFFSLILGLILFVILGGVNQVAVLKAFYHIFQSIGEFFMKLFGNGSIEMNERGIYWRP